MEQEQKLLVRRAQDLAALADKYNTPRFSDFFDEHEQAVIESAFAHPGSFWFGGNTECKRRMLGIFPDWWCDSREEEFPISVLKIENKGRKELTHRDFLGTLMSLGLERKKVGDIAVWQKEAYVFMTHAAAEHACSMIEKVAGCGVRCSVIAAGEAKMPPQKFEVRDIVAASMRLDAVCAPVCNLSRRLAAELIGSGRVSVNHVQQTRCDFMLKAGDILSIRGFGRVEIESEGGRTRSDKMHITIKKFI